MNARFNVYDKLNILKDKYNRILRDERTVIEPINNNIVTNSE